MEHKSEVYQYGYDAWQFGYYDAMYDGMDLSSELPCKCEACLKGYAEGQEAALKEIFEGSQSAQHRVQPTGGTGAQDDDALDKSNVGTTASG